MSKPSLPQRLTAGSSVEKMTGSLSMPCHFSGVSVRVYRSFLAKGMSYGCRYVVKHVWPECV